MQIAINAVTRSQLQPPGDISAEMADALSSIHGDLMVTPQELAEIVPVESAPEGGPTAVYRLYDAAGQLLYVGMSAAPQVRIDAHRKQKSWWPQVASLSLEWHIARFHASTAENLAVRTGRPLHNRHYASGGPIHVHHHVRAEVAEIRRSADPEAAARAALANPRASHHMREIGVLAYLLGVLHPGLPAPVVRRRDQRGLIETENPMSYRTHVTGEFAITPPLSWPEFKDSRFAPDNAKSNRDPDLLLVVTEENVDTPEGPLLRRTATALAMREIDEYNSRDLLAQVQEAVDSFPGHEWSGRLDCEGEESADLWRVVIRDGRAVRVEPTIVWPEDSE